MIDILKELEENWANDLLFIQDEIDKEMLASIDTGEPFVEQKYNLKVNVPSDLKNGNI